MDYMLAEGMDRAGHTVQESLPGVGSWSANTAGVVK
jgi:hypothetical protein